MIVLFISRVSVLTLNQILMSPDEKSTGSLPLQYMVKARGQVNLGGATANGLLHGNGDDVTVKSVLLTTITDSQSNLKYTYTFTVNGSC